MTNLKVVFDPIVHEKDATGTIHCKHEFVDSFCLRCGQQQSSGDDHEHFWEALTPDSELLVCRGCGEAAWTWEVA